MSVIEHVWFYYCFNVANLSVNLGRCCYSSALTNTEWAFWVSNAARVGPRYRFPRPKRHLRIVEELLRTRCNTPGAIIRRWVTSSTRARAPEECGPIGSWRHATWPTTWRGHGERRRSFGAQNTQCLRVESEPRRWNYVNGGVASDTDRRWKKLPPFPSVRTISQRQLPTRD